MIGWVLAAVLFGTVAAFLCIRFELRAGRADRRRQHNYDAMLQITSEAKTDALVAIERARADGMFDDEQIARLWPLVRWLRKTR